MSQPKPLSVSERYRALAEKCRVKARSFRNAKPRTQMLQLAAEYERKASQAEAPVLLANLAAPHSDGLLK